MDFPLPFLENMGGALYFYFIETSDVLSETYAANHQVSALTLKEGAQMSAGYATPGSLSLKADPVESEHGTYFPTEVKGFFPRPPASLVAEFFNMVNRKYIVLLRDGNNKTRMAGTLEQPLRFSFSEDTGSRAQDNPGAAFRFTGNINHPPYFYTPSLSFPTLTEPDGGQEA